MSVIFAPFSVFFSFSAWNQPCIVNLFETRLACRPPAIQANPLKRTRHILGVYFLDGGSFECSVSHPAFAEFDYGNNSINNNIIYVLFLALLYPCAAFETSRGAKY